MSTALRIAFAVTLFTTGIVAAVYFSELIGMNPLLRPLGAEEYLRLKQVLMDAYDPTMPIIGIGGSVFYLAWLVLQWRNGRASARFVLGAAAFVLLAASTVVTSMGELPANALLAKMVPSAPAANWAELREKTFQVIQVRTWLAMASFLVLCVGATFNGPRKELA
ncbi:MAG TPA: DUF1772 domain-containing protein [Myxococcales bacterium]|jgi:hypothetical protein|nr:DUF1772 domain-containing protein [Myxococcales bacterium]